MTQLYLICWDDADGENLDFFVEAESADSALALWEAHVRDEFDREPYDDVRVWRVPSLTGNRRVHPWEPLIVPM